VRGLQQDRSRALGVGGGLAGAFVTRDRWMARTISLILVSMAPFDFTWRIRSVERLSLASEMASRMSDTLGASR